MQFQVPQFIDIEDKIVGPFSLKQFGYIAAAALLIFVFFFMFKTALWVGISIPIALVAASFALIKYNGRPLPYLALSIARYLWQPRFYLWEHRAAPAPAPTVAIPKLKPRPMLRRSAPTVPHAPPAAPRAKPASPPGAKTRASLLELLGFKLTAYTSPIPRREPIPKPVAVAQPSENSMLLRRLMKERELSRRVDYR